MHEKGEEWTGLSGRGYSEWAWPLCSIHLRKGENEQGDGKGDGREVTMQSQKKKKCK